MKNMLKNIFVICLALVICSCEEKYDMYNMTDDKLGFVYSSDEDTLKSVSFVYMNSSITRDTIWAEMATSGYIADYDRPFMIEQVQLSDGDIGNVTGIVNAEPDKHYVAFDDAEIANLMVVKAGENRVKLPVIVKRDDSYLKEGKVYLRLKLKETETFKEAFPATRFYTIELTDMLVKPVGWDIMYYYFAGDYGPAKLRFMIDAATWTINDEWFEENFGNYWVVDMGYTGYLSTFYTNKLIEHNRQRQAQGLDVLKEEDGTIVQFVSYGMPQPYI